MTYQVIARKWRPQTFEEVTGQEPITHTLRNAVEHNRLHHAYIFSGARGVGKTSTARLFAKALNCHKSDKPTPTPCRTDDEDICSSCREIAEGRSIDVQEIDAASTTGVQNVRDSIIDTIGIAPARDRYKVFIIDEVHMLSTAAFNALLKTLEEPPPRVVFIMATTEGHKLLDTIVSRCQQFEFRTIATARIAERLRFIADAENVNVTDEALREIARAGEGSMRDAQSALDQVISFSGTEIKAADVEAALGIAGVDVLARLMSAIEDKNSAGVLLVVDELVMRGHDLRNFCRDFMAFIRDMLVAKASGDAAAMLELSESERAELAQHSKSFSESDLVRFFHSLTETESALRDAAHPRYHLEVGLIKLIEMGRLVPLQQIIDRLNALEKSLNEEGSVASGPTPSSTGGTPSKERADAGKSRSSKASAAKSSVDETEDDIVGDDLVESLLRTASQSATSPRIVAAPQKSEVEPELSTPTQDTENPIEENVTDVTSALGTIVDRIKSALEKRRPFLFHALHAAHTVGLDGQELSVEFATDAKHLRDNLATPDNVKILREVCCELLGYEVGVRISVGERTGGVSEGPVSREDEERQDKKRMREYAEKHPAVQQVLQTFHGEIVDVRRVEPESNPAARKLE
jgi:DNA polymerase-3 subunit gamma/tau